MLCLPLSHAGVAALDWDRALQVVCVTSLLPLVLLGVVGGCLVFVLGFFSACPKCHRWWMVRQFRLWEVAREEGLGLLDRWAMMNIDGWDGSDERGRLQPCGRTCWKQRGPTIRTTLRHRHECRHCGYNWSETIAVGKEDFAARPAC